MIRTYSELISIPTFIERYEYLKLEGSIGELTFGGRRQLNQILYHDPEWRRIRREVILRDHGRDLAFEGRELNRFICVHHLEPITIDDILDRRPKVFDMENLVCTSSKTHKAIHYGNKETLQQEFIERTFNDTCPWR